MRLLFSALKCGVPTLVSRALGFVRDILFAFIVGTGTIADAFIVAFRLPNMFRALFAEGAMNDVFIPIFKKEYAKDKLSGQYFAQSIFSHTVLWGVGFILLMIVNMPYVVAVQAQGFIADGQKFLLTISLAKILFSYLSIMMLNALFTAILNALGKFALPAMTQCLLNIFFILILMLIDIGLVPLTGYEIAVSILISGLVQCGILLWACNKNHVRPYGFQQFFNANITVFFKRALPIIIGASMAQCMLFVSTLLATNLAKGTISNLYYAERLIQLPLGVVGIAVSTALLPTLVTAISDNNKHAISVEQNNAILLALSLTLPATIALFTISMPIVDTLFHHGAFDAAATHKTARILQYLVVGLPAWVLNKIFLKLFYAHGNTKTPMYVSLITLIIYSIAAVPLMQTLQGAGLALASTIGAWCCTAMLYGMMKKYKYQTVTPSTWFIAAKILLCSIVMGVFLWQLSHVFSPRDTAKKALDLFVLVIGGTIVYFATLIATKTLKICHIKNFFSKISNKQE